DSNIDPALFTPTKRMRMMVGSLASSSSGSFLISKARLNSSQTVAGPVLEQPPDDSEVDWTLAQSLRREVASGTLTKPQLESKVTKLTDQVDLCQRHIQILRMINEGANAQLIIQDMYCSK
ncbi:hypothetical protein SCHPADRAFT_803089, partial [Schizopora paradoxa]